MACPPFQFVLLPIFSFRKGLIKELGGIKQKVGERGLSKSKQR
jgi:hypothetical protein